jgi:hypothetical protein
MPLGLRVSSRTLHWGNRKIDSAQLIVDPFIWFQAIPKKLNDGHMYHFLLFSSALSLKT